jgi:hypothetical protein
VLFLLWAIFVDDIRHRSVSIDAALRRPDPICRVDMRVDTGIYPSAKSALLPAKILPFSKN